MENLDRGAGPSRYASGPRAAISLSVQSTRAAASVWAEPGTHHRQLQKDVFVQGGTMSSREPPFSELPPEQMTSIPLALMGITEGGYSHVQHIIQAHPEAHAGSAGGPHGSSVISPLTSAQAIDLSTSGEDHCQVQPGDTPLSHGLVPNFVLARVTNEENSCMSPGSPSNPTKSTSSARVCLEKRFDTLRGDNTTQQDVQSAVFNSILSRLQQIAEPQNVVFHPEEQKTDTVENFCVSNSHVMSVYDPDQNICGQVVALVEPGQHQQFILPKTFTFNFQPERVVAKNSSSINVAQEDADTLAASRCYFVPHPSETPKAAKVDSNSAKRPRRNVRKGTHSMSVSQRKERHNSLERERRRKIRLCCDELNTLLPFCNTTTDKLTTLQRAVAFLRYVSEAYGDSLKEEFVVFSHRKGLFLKSSPSSGLSPILKEVDDTHSVPLGVEP